MAANLPAGENACLLRKFAILAAADLFPVPEIAILAVEIEFLNHKITIASLEIAIPRHEIAVPKG